MKYTIFASLQPAVKAALDKLIKKGANFYTIEYSQPYKGTRDVYIDGQESHFPASVQLVDVTIEGEYRPSEDYTLVAKLEPMGDANVIVKLNTAHDVPESYRVAHNHCDHCNKKRKRNEYYLVKSLDTGKLLQIGKTCLADFFPITSGEVVAFALLTVQMISTMEEYADGEGGGGSSAWETLEIECVLALALEETQKHGYVKSSDEYGCSTKDAVLIDYFKHKPSEEAVADVAKMLAWLNGQPSNSDYLHNLKTLVNSSSFVSRKHIGLMASLPNVWLKALAKIEEGKRSQGELVEVSEGRQPITGVVLSFKEYESEYGFTVKMLVQCDGYRAWGSRPNIAGGIGIGDTVEFSGDVTPKEIGFCFYKRPTKARVVKHAGEAA